MAQSVLGQSDCKIFKSTISQEQSDEIAWFFCMLIQILGNKKFVDKVCMCKVKNECSHSGHSNLNFAVSQEEMYGINRYFACWYKFIKTKGYFNDVWVNMVKNGHVLLGHRTLKFTVSQKWLMIWDDCLHADTNSEKLKVTLTVFWWALSKMGMTF